MNYLTLLAADDAMSLCIERSRAIPEHVTVNCLANGAFVIEGTAHHLRTRECEEEHEHDAGLELRDYMLMGRRPGAPANELWSVVACAPFNRGDQVGRVIPPGAVQDWRVKCSFRLHT